eukprot:7532075-Ditylum_brightwellii.AAC.1
MAFDVDVTWESEIQAKMMITISNCLASVMGRWAVSLPLTVHSYSSHSRATGFWCYADNDTDISKRAEFDLSGVNPLAELDDACH